MEGYSSNLGSYPLAGESLNLEASWARIREVCELEEERIKRERQQNHSSICDFVTKKITDIFISHYS